MTDIWVLLWRLFEWCWCDCVDSFGATDGRVWWHDHRVLHCRAHTCAPCVLTCT